MKKIIFCDLNEELVKQVDILFKKFEKNNKWNINFSTHNGDIFEYHEKNGGLIATASNPSFSMGGGLDGQIAMKFSNEVTNPKEFKITKNLFFTVTVDSHIKATEKIVERALIGAFSYSENEIIISGFGTVIGGLPNDKFLEILEKVCGADMSGADMSGANMSGADMSGANMSVANMRGANMSYANMSYADMSGANMSYANMSYAYMRGANMSYADMSGANMSGANMRGANMSGADMSGANMSGADMSGAENLDSVSFNEGTAFFALACPEEGSFTAWKKASGNIIKLEIPQDAKRSSATTRKCRASKAKVIAIYNSEGKEIKECYSSYDSSFIYKVGKIVNPVEKYEEDRWNECASGIHFFITKKEAEQWN